MTGHFDCVGMPLPDPAGYEDLLRSVLDRGVTEPGPGTQQQVRWQDPSGAGLSVFIEDQAVQCAKPTAAPVTRTTVLVDAAVADPIGCAWCAMVSVEVLEGGEMAYPLLVELDEMLATPAWLAPGSEREIGITAFAEDIESWPDEAAFRASGSMFATKSLVPSGMFSPGGEAGQNAGHRVSAHAIATGVVTAAEIRTNSLTGQPFQLAVLDTLATQLTVVATTAHPTPTLTPGHIAQGTFWLVARAAPPT